MKYQNEIKHLISDNLDNTIIIENNEVLKNDTLLNIDFKNGININTKDKQIIEEQIKLIILFDKENINLNINYNIGINSSLDLLESFYNVKTTKGIININTTLKDNSNFKYTTFDRICEDSTIEINRITNQQKHSNYKQSLTYLNDCNTKSTINTNLNEEGAICDSKLVAIANNKKEQNISIKIEHFAPNTEGFINNSGVVNDEAKLIFNGIGKINKGMKQSNAQQTTRGTILSEKGTLEANPLLLIDENDVKAGHGASVGKISDEGLYYLMSRGLTKKEAEKLIVNGFLNPIEEDIKDEAIIKEFRKTINQKLK